MNLATLLIIMWVIVLIGICFIVKKLNAIEEKMTKFHNYLVDSIDTYYKDTVNNLSDFHEALDIISENQQKISRQTAKCFNELDMKLDNLQENWSDLKSGSIQVLTVK